MSLFSFSEHPMFVACLGPQQTLKYVTVSLIFILYISKMRICTKVYASILSLIFLKYCIYIIIKVLGINIFDIQKTWSLWISWLDYNWYVLMIRYCYYDYIRSFSAHTDDWVNCHRRIPGSGLLLIFKTRCLKLFHD